MECTASFTSLLSEFQCVFTQPTFQIFRVPHDGMGSVPSSSFCHRVDLVQRLYPQGAPQPLPSLLQPGSWCLDALCCVLAKLLVAVFAPSGMIELAVDDTLCRKRGLTVYGTGMHHDPLISSRAKPLTSWGHDWVVLTLIVRCPFWAPTKVWSLPIAFRLYRNRQGVTKGKKKPESRKPQKKTDPNHRTRPELAVELISLVASWFPTRRLLVSGDSAYGGAERVAETSGERGVDQPRASRGRLVRTGPGPIRTKRERLRKKGRRLPGMAAWADDPRQPWQELVFDQFGLHATLLVKTLQALYYKAGKDRLVDDRTGARCLWANGPIRCSTARVWIGTRERFSRSTRRDGRSRSPSRTASNCWDWKTRPTAKKRRCGEPRRWRWCCTA